MKLKHERIKRMYDNNNPLILKTTSIPITPAMQSKNVILHSALALNASAPFPVLVPSLCVSSADHAQSA